MTGRTGREGDSSHPERLEREGGAAETVHEHLARYLVAGEVARRLVARRRRPVRVLDLGCGAGLGSDEIARTGAGLVVGLDRDLVANVAGPGVRFIAGSAGGLPFRDGSFDLVVCLEVVEHLASPDECMAEVRRVLAPGGVLFLSTPNRARGRDALPDLNPHHLSELDRAGLDRLLARHFAAARIEGMAGQVVQRVGTGGQGRAAAQRRDSIGPVGGIVVRRLRGAGTRTVGGIEPETFLALAAAGAGASTLASLLPNGALYAMEGWGPRDSYVLYRRAIAAHETNVRDLERGAAVLERVLGDTRELLEDLSARHEDLARRHDALERSRGVAIERRLRARIGRARAVLRKLSPADVGRAAMAGPLALLVWTLLGAAMAAGDALAPLRSRRNSPAGRPSRTRLPPEPRVNVTIVNWNGGVEFASCLESVARQTYPRIEVLVWDNGSTDGSLDAALALSLPFPIDVVRGRANVGFSRAQNALFARASGDLVLPLNFDVVLEPTFVTTLVEAFEDDPGLGMASGLLVCSDPARPEGPPRIDSTGVELRNYYCADRGQGGTLDEIPPAGEVFGASGAAPLYRRAMLDQASVAAGEVFDEDFFQYVEDVDLAWRARLLGWGACFVPQARARHERGTTRRGEGRGKEGIRRGYLVEGMRNRYLMIVKNAHLSHVARRFPGLVAAETRFWMHCVRTRRLYALRAVPGMLARLGRMIGKRAAIHGARACDPAGLERWFFPQAGGGGRCA